ncbi:YcnI family protein [Actinoplanes sp. NBC_00393]|uniref:DUF1775 domain-containing protein n=1 Tax=Actinoplanes sp. NBC_00393 TaxID=2975953 RepID=UPI002E1BCBA5
MRRPALGLLAVAMSAALLLLTGSPAAAHVLLAEAQPNGDGSTALTFTFDHGCGESPTTELIVTLPPGAAEPSATRQPDGWRAVVAPDRVTWTGPALNAGAEAAFTLTTRLTGSVGQTLRFPTLQHCANGEAYRWIDTESDAEHPAPSLIATRAVLASAAASPQAAAGTAPSTGGGTSLPQALGALAVFVVAVSAVAAALGRRARHPASPPVDQPAAPS